MKLSYVWKQSIKQWTWIVKQLNDGSLLSVSELKHLWLKQHQFRNQLVVHNCLLCEYAHKKKVRISSKLCKNCPARLSNPHLGHYWCQVAEHSWNKRPVEFLVKLKEEYAIYLEKDNT